MRTLSSTLDVDRLRVEREEPHGVGRHVDQPRDLALRVAEDLPVRVAGDLEVLAGAAAELDEGVVERARLEEAREPRALRSCELHERAPARGDLLGCRLELGVAGEVPSLLSGESLEVNALPDASVGVVGVEVDRGVEAVTEAIDVGCVGVDVLAERVRMLEEEAERLGVVRWLERAGDSEERTDPLATGGARGIGHARAEDDRFEDGLQARVRGVCRAREIGHGARSSTYATRPVGQNVSARTR